jgi:predicted transcriptional regulator
MAGHKIIELRRQFSKAHQGAMVLIYSSSPQQAILGYARISDVRQVDTSVVKDEFLDMVGCDSEQVDNYSQGVDSLWALTLSNVESFFTPLCRKILESSLQTQLRPPVSHQTVDQKSSWWKIIESVSSSEIDILNLRTKEEKEIVSNHSFVVQTTLF